MGRRRRYVDPFDRRRARPCNAADHEVAGGHDRAVGRLGDQRSNPLQPHRLEHGVPSRSHS